MREANGSAAASLPAPWLWAWRWPLVAIAGVAPAAYFTWTHVYSMYDDAYIYLRYVESVRAGCGLRFNCADPPVEGFTSPLHLALLLIGRLFTPNLELLTQWLGALYTGGAIVLAASLAFEQQLAPPPGWRLPVPLAIAVVLGVDHRILLNATIGLETALGGCVAVACFRASLRGKPTQVAVWVLVGFLVRPELLLMAMLLPVHVHASAGEPLLRRARPALLLGVGLVVVTVARAAVFGDLLPNTYFAKAGGTARHVELGFAYVVETLAEFPLIAAAPLALALPSARRHVASLLAATVVWFLYFLRTGGDTFHYGRLAVPLVPLLTALGVLGASQLLRRFARARAYGVVAAAAWCAWALHSRTIPPQHGFENVDLYKRTGLYLRRFPRRTTVATVPIGAVSYYSKLHVIDLVGLTQAPIAKAGRTVPPERLDREWIGHERHLTEWVVAQAPDVIATTSHRDRPWILAEASAGFVADWLLMRGVKDGTLPYEVHNAEIRPGVFLLLFTRLPGH